MKKESVPGILLFDDARYSHRKALEDAHGYFDVLSAARTEGVSDAHFKGANEIGMVDLVCLTNAPGGLTADDDQELTAALESLSNILVAAVLKKCGADPKKLVDPTMWEAGYNALISLFCSGYSDLGFNTPPLAAVRISSTYKNW